MIQLTELEAVHAQDDALAVSVRPEHERGVANGFMFAGASVGQIQAPPSHSLCSEHLQALQQPAKQGDRVGIVMGPLLSGYFRAHVELNLMGSV